MMATGVLLKPVEQAMRNHCGKQGGLAREDDRIWNRSMLLCLEDTPDEDPATDPLHLKCSKWLCLL